MTDAFSFILEYWWVAPWLGAIAAAFRFGGWRLALSVALPGAGVFLYRKGLSDQKKWRREKDEKIRRRLDEAYGEIDSRNISDSDLTDRLRRGDF